MNLRKLLKGFLDVILMLLALGLGLISFMCFVLVCVMSYGSVIFKRVEKNFDNREDAKMWILENQLGRRNLNESQRYWSISVWSIWCGANWEGGC